MSLQIWTKTVFTAVRIEKLLVQSLYSDYTRLYRFSGMDQKKFLELYLSATR